ncbi:D-alanyl-D-alanine carboxypeptidase [Sphingomonas glacialis]|uniref:D-alanyl-D-alanine carboxypeptidase n=1 Tax=Sphingomonas glacialis TaxID=658225 RepID=A0A502FR71_9SPHN|nr:D-alanyl-D-alanine carboxypeptidase [Sphingomonas glacialis]
MAFVDVSVRVPPARSTRIVFGILALGCGLAAQPSSARVAPRAPVSELLINASTGRVIFANLPDSPHRPASLTKMMTLYLLYDALESGRVRVTESIPVSRNAARQPASRLGLTAGTSLPLRTAVQAMAVHSANDVTVAIAERLAGNEADFAVLMNAKARQLGMTRTSFANASGLTNAGNQTTARDMVTLARALLRDHPREYPVFATRAITWRSRRYVNHDHLLGKVGGVDGIKTGYTADAGYNIATSAKRGGVRVIAVVLGEKSVQARDVRVANLVELGFTPPARHRRGAF